MVIITPTKRPRNYCPIKYKSLSEQHAALQTAWHRLMDKRMFEAAAEVSSEMGQLRKRMYKMMGLKIGAAV